MDNSKQPSGCWLGSIGFFYDVREARVEIFRIFHKAEASLL
jgi:hypothetical protein